LELSNIAVRELLPGEEKTVRDFYRQSLGLIDGLIFQLAFRDALKSAAKRRGTTLVAVFDGRCVGSVSLRILAYSGKTIGLIDAIVTDRNVRGRGVGRLLLDSALSWLEGRGCGIVWATADRFNSPSWNMFIHKGFSVYGLRRQLKDVGLNFIRLWLTEFYIFGGTFYLSKTDSEEKQKEAGEASHFLAAWLGLSFAWWLIALRGGASVTIVPQILWITGLSIVAHELAHKTVAAWFGLKTTFKSWDSGILFSSLLAMLGALYPAYGSTYMKQLDWRYDPRSRDAGLIYVAGPITSLGLAVLFWTLLQSIGAGPVAIAARMGYITNLSSAILNLLPIQSAGLAWDGNKVFSWNKTFWSLLSGMLVLMVIIDVLV